jgi:lysophospholipid acyltransferase (LPLAT)-like uncharacterized protein
LSIPDLTAVMAMTDDMGSVSVADRPKRKRGSLQRSLKRFGRRLLRQPRITTAAGRLVHDALRFVHWAQRPVAGSSDFTAVLTEQHPAIVALWHGQHLLAPFFRPPTLPYVALLSRNADAEINAAVVERFGIDTVRGSGGRVRNAVSRKGGARALIVLKRLLGEGKGVCMIADVPKGTPRQAGLGIVTLARLSGRPIIPSAAVTSRRRIIANSWDKTAIPLPFGRLAVVLGEPIFVPADADDAVMEQKRVAVTLAIEAANAKAQALVAAL